MPKLENDATASAMHGFGDSVPCVHLRISVDPRRERGPTALLRYGSGLGNDQSGRSSLPIVFGGERGLHSVAAGPGSGHRSHNDTIRDGDASHHGWRE